MSCQSTRYNTHTLPLLSACPETFIFSTSLSQTQAELPCSQLDGSFLPGGMVTARCTANNTWGPLDMSQCTFTNGISVAAVAVVEVQSLVEDAIFEKDVRDKSLIHYILLYVALILIIRHRYFL